MKKQDYMKLIKSLCGKFTQGIVIYWKNGLKVKGYICDVGETPSWDVKKNGVYYAIIEEIEILEEPKDDTVAIAHNPDCDSIEINMTTIPEKITLEDGTIVWEKKSIT